MCSRKSFECYAGLWRKLVKRLLPIMNEVKLVIDKNGVSCITVDPSHVCMVKASIPRKDFYLGNNCVNMNISYKLGVEKLEIGVDLEKFMKTLRLFTDYDKLTGYIQNNRLYFKTDEIEKKFSLLDTYGFIEPKEPDLKYSVDVEVSSNRLTKLLKACETSEYTV